MKRRILFLSLLTQPTGFALEQGGIERQGEEKRVTNSKTEDDQENLILP